MNTLEDTVRVLIADDDFDMRLLVRTTIGSEAGLDIVAEAEDGPGALAAFRATHPDVCVLDYRMPGLTGIEAAEQILTEDPRATVLLFSAYLTPEITDEAAALGITCLRKDLFMELPSTVMRLARHD